MVYKQAGPAFTAKPPYADWTAINVGGLDEKANAED